MVSPVHGGCGRKTAAAASDPRNPRIRGAAKPSARMRAPGV